MTSFTVAWEEAKSKLSLSGAITLAALLLGVSVFVVAANISRANPERVIREPSRSKVSVSVLIAATRAGANDLIAKGELAKVINASLPFDIDPVQPAQPFLIDVEAANYPRALLCLQAAVYHEAGFEPLAGRQAVAQVILNRVRHPAFPKSVCEVVYQGAASPVCQFSFACDEARHRPVAEQPWQEARQVAAQALGGYVEAPVGTATHYHADYVAPRWAPLLTKVSKTGAHIFYRWPGSWGERPAFLRRYLGEEASTIGRAMEFEAAALAALHITGARGIELVEVRNGKVAPAVVRGNHGRGPARAAGGLWDVGAHEDLVAATVAGRLVEHEVVSWDTPMRELFPDLAVYMGAKLQAVTLLQLLSDRLVFPAKSNPDFAFNLAAGAAADQLTLQRAAFLKKAINAVGGEQKGVGQRSPRLVIAAAAMEGVTGLPYDQLARNEVFRPLGLRSASFVSQRTPGAKPAPARPDGRTPPLSQAGQLRMSLGDFSTFLIDQMKGAMGEGKLLSVANYRRPHKISQNEPTRRVVGRDCFLTSLRGTLQEERASYWIAGVSMGTDRKRLIVTGIPEGRNKLATFSRTLEISQVRIPRPRSRPIKDQGPCPAAASKSSA